MKRISFSVVVILVFFVITELGTQLAFADNGAKVSAEYLFSGDMAVSEPMSLKDSNTSAKASMLAIKIDDAVSFQALGGHASIDLTARQWRYEYDKPAAESREDVSSLYSAIVNASFQKRFGSHSVSAYFFPGYYSDGKVSFADSLKMNLSGIYSYSFHKAAMLGAGLYYTSIKGEGRLIPLITAFWSSGPHRFTALLPYEFAYYYQFQDSWLKAGVRAQVFDDRYAIEDSARDSKVIKQTAILLGPSLRADMDERLSIELFAGAITFNKFTNTTGPGRDEDMKLDSTWFVSLSGSIRF